MVEQQKSVLMEIKQLTKIFPGVRAVDDVSLTIRKGEVHIIIGENGAGKSTLVKMMAGIYSLNGGEMFIEGEKYEPMNVLQAQKAGINMIHQELNVMPHRTVAQNIYVGREPVKGVLHMVDTKKMNQMCSDLLNSLEIDIDPCMLIKDLSIAQQQMVEVAKAISNNNKLLIMDEPTSSLTHKEIDSLFKMTRKLRDDGVAIIYISHRMQELMEIGDVVTIMRDGCHVGTRRIDEVDMAEIIYLMVGRKIEKVYNRTYNEPGNVVIETQQLTGKRFRNVNMNVRKGEIVGLAGLVGAGRTEIAKAIFGYDAVDSGSLVFNGEEISLKSYSTFDAVQKKISFIPEDRKQEGLCIKMSINDNIVMSALPQLFHNSIVNDRLLSKVSKKGIKDLGIVTTSGNKKVNNLSGGNQQKVVIAKWMVTDSDLFIFDEPTRGIDVGAKAEIYTLMNNIAKQGAGILMISSDLPELIGLADRIYVVKDGELTGEVAQKDFSQEYILGLAL